MIRFISAAIVTTGLLIATGNQAFAAKSNFSTEGFVRCDERYTWTCDQRGYENPIRVRGKKGGVKTRGAPHYDGGQRIVSHPAGCPSRAFCGCGVSVRVFGRPIRDLFLAANWRKFPPTHLAPGTVAYRSHHVVYVEDVRSDGTAIVYDPNSGHHLTRIHARSLAGFRVVDPHRG